MGDKVTREEMAKWDKKATGHVQEIPSVKVSEGD